MLLGAAEHDHGVTRLWKALRHDTPGPAVTAARLGVPAAPRAADDALTASVVKTFHQAHAGKLSLARIWGGELRDNAALAGGRAGLYRMKGGDLAKTPVVRAGDLVAIARVEALGTGDVLAGGERVAAPDMDWPEAPAPVYALALEPEKRADEVKLTSGLAKLVEEDPSLAYGHDDSTGLLLIRGQGPQHLALALARFENRFNVATTSHAPGTPYRESIRKTVRKHTRFKRQTGGHGQFADIHVTLAPRPRGAGFVFDDRVVVGAVPRGYIPAVETGIREGLQSGPLGFPVVDVAATLEDGQYHAVDSSEQAFKTTARMAVADALPEAQPVLLEPVDLVSVYVPQSLSNKVHGMISGQRGQILGFDSCAEWDGWDAVQAYMPAAELADLIVELRSLSMGVGFFERRFDHLQEVTGKLVDKILSRERAPIAAT